MIGNSVPSAQILVLIQPTLGKIRVIATAKRGHRKEAADGPLRRPSTASGEYAKSAYHLCSISKHYVRELTETTIDVAKLLVFSKVRAGVFTKVRALKTCPTNECPG